MGRYPSKRASKSLMKIEILCEGKIKRDHNISLCNEYCDRVRKLKRSGVTELKINKLSSNILNNIKKKNQTLYVLSENGKFIGTKDLLNIIKNSLMKCNKIIYFVIGNADGLNFDYKNYVNLSLGKLTFTHSLTRLIFCEQIYRCVTQLINHPYHKE